MKLLFNFLFFISSFSVAQSDSSHWTQLINQPQIDYYKIKTAFESEQKQLSQLHDFNNTQLLKKDSTANLSERHEGLYNLFKRWEYFILPHLDKNGNYDAIKESADLNRYFEGRISKNNKQISIANWQSIGPFKTPNSSYATIGRVECIAFHPTDVNTFYIGTPSGGVWKTIDGGTNWQYLSQTWDDQAVNGLTIHPTNPSIIFVTKSNGRLLKSTDAGVTWSQLQLFYYNLGKLLINPNNPQIMLSYSGNMVIRTVDGGNIWTNYQFDNPDPIEDLKFKPDNPSVIYTTSRKAVYKSIDGGITFNTIYSLPTTSIAANIAVTPAAPNSVYIAYNSNISLGQYLKFGAIFKSTDSGNTFSVITDENTSVDFQTMGTIGYTQGRYDLTLTVSPTNENEIWLGIVPLFKTTNGGASWQSAGGNGITVHVDQHATEYQPISGKVFIGCDGGLYRFTHSTNTYEILDGMNITQIYRMGGLQNFKNKFLYGSQDNGIHKWESNDFKNILGADGMECIIDNTNHNTIYASTQYGDLYKSVNNSTSWSNVTPSPKPSYTQWVTPWEIDPTNNQILYSGYNEVYKSVNGGTSWSKITNFNINQRIKFIKIAPSNNNILYTFCGSDYYFQNANQFRKSIDGGVTWSILNLPSTGFWGYDLAINFNDANNIWMIGQSKVYNSIDGGISWTDATGTLPGIGFNCIVFDKFSGDLYLGTSAGVFVRPLNSSDWIFFNDGLPKVNVQELEISYADGNLLRAATYGRGLWETATYTPCSMPLASISANSSVVIAGGESVTLQANTDSGLTYHWFKDGILINGGTNSNYVASDIGEYSVLVKNSNCSKYSNTITVTTSATLNLNINPTYVCKGTNVSVPFTATNFAIGTTFTVEFIDANNNNFVYSSITGTVSPLTLLIPSYYNYSSNSNFKIQIRANNSVTLKATTNNFQVKNINTNFGIGTENGYLFNSYNSVLQLCPGKSTKLYALKYNNTNPSATFTYQWKLNGTNIVSATDSSLIINQSGNYSVSLSEIGGCSETTYYAVNVNTSNSLTPTLRTVGPSIQCSNVLLESLYSSSTATYQWKKDGTIIPNVNNSSYRATSSGVYTLNITDGGGCTINSVSRNIKVGKLEASIFSYDTLICSTNGYSYIYLNNPPTNTSYDSPPNFTTGISYQWQKNGQDILNDVNANQNGFYARDGIYTLKIKQQSCEAISNPFQVKLTNTLPVYTKSNSVSTVLCSGQSVLLQGFGYGSFTWQKDGVDLNYSQYTATTSGSYTLKRVQGSCTSISPPINLSFGNGYTPIITSSYNATKACNSTNLSISGYVPSGSTYQWRKNGININGATNNNYLATSTGSYDLIITNVTCSGISNIIPITIGSIEAEIVPFSTSLYCKNSTQKFSLNKVDYNNSQIQWKRNGVAITGAILSEYIADVSGNYTALLTQGSCSYETVPFVIPLRPISTAILTGNTTITGGQTAIITANINGISPWAITLSDDIIRYSSSTPFYVSVSPSSTQTYSIKSLTDGCSYWWGCIPAWNLTTSSSLSREAYQAQQTINSISNILAPTNIEYKAGNNILLSPGFKVENGAVFKAEILGCNNP
jgi:photosystem II stability/assembly factor-like uncharacterized protein